jgi:hypothetical protein
VRLNIEKIESVPSELVDDSEERGKTESCKGGGTGVAGLPPSWAEEIEVWADSLDAES